MAEDFFMKCYFCKELFNEKLLREHHIHPRFMDNQKGDGLKIYICDKCHNILHLTIPKLIWNKLDEAQRKECIQEVIKFTKDKIK